MSIIMASKDLSCYFTHPSSIFISDPEVSSYNVLFQNEWCEVTCIPKAGLGLSQLGDTDLPSKVSDSVLSSSSIDDWRVQTGMAVGGQTWGQQSGNYVVVRSRYIIFKPHRDQVLFMPQLQCLNVVREVQMLIYNMHDLSSLFSFSNLATCC